MTWLATQFQHPEVERVFAAYPDGVRGRMLELRALVFEMAAGLPVVGRVEETLKWGEPAYLTPESRSGSTIRMDWKARAPEVCGLYFNCHTSLVAGFRDAFGGVFRYEGERAVLVPVDGAYPREAVARCFAAALTYHRRGIISTA